MAELSGPGMRARHDAGRSPVLLRRLLLLVAVAGTTAGLGVMAAGAARVGPLAALGWTERVFTPEAVLAPAPADRATELQIGFGWNRPTFCAADFTVKSSQSPSQVVVRSITSRMPRFSLLAPGCAQQQTRGGRAYARLRLTGPLLGRPVLSGTGRPLAVEPG